MGDFEGHLAGKWGSKGLILGLKTSKKVGFSSAEEIFSYKAANMSEIIAFRKSRWDFCEP